MDVSKLPRLSQTPSPPQPDSSPPATQPPMLPAASPQLGVGAEAWISLVIGILLLMLGWRFARYLAATLTGQTFHTEVVWTSGPLAGQEVPYFNLSGFVAISESAMFLFGLALIFEAAALFVAFGRFRFRAALVCLAAIVAFAATAYNLVAAVLLFTAGVIPTISLLAVAFGGYMVIYLWKLWLIQRGQAAPMT